MLTAYDDVRLEATAGADLTSDLLARWNRIIRGVPVAAFRRAPAHAKNGRERYGLHADTEHRFASCLAETADRETPVTARAARAYLDVAFFHPYDDGNARLAGAVLQFVLLRECVELDEVTPILTTVRRADDAEGAADLARLVHGIATATHRRWLRANGSAKVDHARRHPGQGQRALLPLPVPPRQRAAPYDQCSATSGFIRSHKVEAGEPSGKSTRSSSRSWIRSTPTP